MIDDRNETKRGMLWLGSATAITRALDVCAALIVIALLTREEMGTAALALSVGTVVESVSGAGLGHALVQARGLTKEHEYSLFWLSTAIGALLGLVLIVAAPVIAYAYDEPDLLPMVAITSVKMATLGAAVVPQHLLSKHLQFREAGAVQTLSSLGEGVAKISFAALGLGAWSLVLSNALRGFIVLGVVLSFSSFRPRRHFAWAEARGYLQFGLRIAGSGLLYQTYRKADYFLVGKMLGLEALGIYRVAFEVGMQPMEVVLAIINRVAYPIYAKVSHDVVALKGALLRSTRSMSLLGAPIVTFLFFAAADVLALMTNPRWGAAAPAVQVLVWGALLRGAAHVFPQVYAAAGRPNYALLDSAVSMVVLTSCFWLGMAYLPELGVLSVCFAWIVAYPPLLALHLALTRRITPLGTFEYLRSFGPALGGMAATLAAMGVTVPLGLHSGGHLTSLVVWALAGLGGYALYLRFAMKISFRDVVPKRQVTPVASSEDAAAPM